MQYSRRNFLKKTAVLCAAAMGAPLFNRGRFRLFADSPAEFSARTIELINRFTVIDMLGLLTLDFPKLYEWQRDPATFQSADFQKLKDSGINIFHPAVGYEQGDVYAASLRDMARWNHFITRQSGYFLRMDCPADFDRVKTLGKIGIVLGQQDSAHFRSVGDVDRFYKMGQRVSQLTYHTNRLGGGAPDPRNPGLTAFGGRIIERMNSLGMAVDVSHCDDRTTLDAFAASRKPVLVTHSNCRALVPGCPRCKTDEAIRKMAAQGGVMGITMVRRFVRSAGPATTEQVLEHIDRVAHLVGVEHVGIGSDVDLDGRSQLTPELRRAQHLRPEGKVDLDGIDYQKKIFDLTEGLVRRRYSDRNVELILGENFQRALSEIWTV